MEMSASLLRIRSPWSSLSNGNNSTIEVISRKPDVGVTQMRCDEWNKIKFPNHFN